MEQQQQNLITDDFIIQEILEKKHYIELILKKDDEDKISAFIKNNIDIFLRMYKINDHIICQAKPRLKRNKNVLDIVSIKKYDLDNDVQQQQTSSKIDYEKYIKKLDGYIEQVKDKDYRLILDEFFANENIREIFFLSPAAKNNHHNYEFGLLQHSIEVTEIALFIGEYYPPINKDLLITGCLLHDVGKAKSYDFKNNDIIKTEWESFLGHLSLSAIFISKMLPEGFNSQKARSIYHLVLSHHGKKEWGSPVECKTKEAQILHHADMISSTIQHIDNLEYVNGQSKFDELTKRIWFKEGI